MADEQKIVVEVPTERGYSPVDSIFELSRLEEFKKGWVNAIARGAKRRDVAEATSKAEAEAIVADDPLVQKGCVNYQLYEWRIVME